MKKNLLIGLAALAAVTITSCQKDQVINQIPQEQAIEFGTYVGRDAQTKGSVTDITTLCGNTKGFGVFAYYTGTSDYTSTSTPNFMYNQRVYGTASGDPTPTYTWTYSPIKYWPNNTGDKISFFAYAPYDSELNFTSNPGDPKVNINVATDVTNHVDFTYATDENGTTNNLLNQTKQSTTGNIKFHFQHAMSKVGFKVEALIDQVNSELDGKTPDTDEEDPNEIAIADGTTISVESVSLIGSFINSGTLNLNGGTWDGLSTPAVRTYTLNSTNSDFEDIASAVTVDPNQLNKSTEFIMLIPQDDVDITISVTYKVTTIDSNFDELPENGKVVVTNTMSAPLNDFDFKQGTAYNFVLHLGLTSVKFDAEVEEWTETNSDVVVNVPKNN